MRRNTIEESIREELGRYPGIQCEWGQGGKHPYVKVSIPNGKSVKVSYAATTSDKARAHLNTVTDLRRRLQSSLGIVPMGVLPGDVDKVKISALGAALLAKSEPSALVDIPEHVRGDQLELIDPPTKERDKAMTTTQTKVNGSDAEAKAGASAERKTVRMSHSDVALATRLIVSNATIDDAARTVIYNDGWSDKRVLDVVFASAPERRVADKAFQIFRMEAFGRVPEEIVKPSANSDERFAAIERRLAALEAFKRALES